MISTWSKFIGWNNIYWPSVYSKVRHMQCQIRVAYKSNDMNAVKQLQHNLTNSWAARALAVRIVTTNKGKKTGGIDYEIWDTPQQKWEAIIRLHVKPEKYNCIPVRRVYIEKPNGGICPLGIPTIYDRRMQALWK